MYDLFLIFYNMFLVWVMCYEMNWEYEVLLEVCECVENYIVENFCYYQEEKFIDFYIKKMLVYLYFGNYFKGQINVEQCFKQFLEGSKFWFIFMEYYLLLVFYIDYYIQVLVIYNQMVFNKCFIKQGVELWECWCFFEVVIYFLLELMGLVFCLIFICKRDVFLFEKFIEWSFYYGVDQKKFMVLMLSM